MSPWTPRCWFGARPPSSRCVSGGLLTELHSKLLARSAPVLRLPVPPPQKCPCFQRHCILPPPPPNTPSPLPCPRCLWPRRHTRPSRTSDSLPRSAPNRRISDRPYLSY